MGLSTPHCEIIQINFKGLHFYHNTIYTLIYNILNTLCNPAQVKSAPPLIRLGWFLKIPIKSKVFIQTLHKTQVGQIATVNHGIICLIHF